jgi:hypothetical protein
LAPTAELLSDYKYRGRDVQAYWERYKRETLAPLDPTVVYQEFLAYGGPDVAICCFEKPPSFCHRQIVAHWLNHQLGVVVPEYGIRTAL